MKDLNVLLLVAFGMVICDADLMMPLGCTEL